MLQTVFLALLGLMAGVVLHLHWHPLRREFSDAWDFLRSHQWLVVAIAGLMLLAGRVDGFTADELQDWRALWQPALRRACTSLALLFHALLPPWPVALIAPLALLVLTIRVWRWPYRYGERVPVPEQKLVLIGLSTAGVIWAVLEAAGVWSALPEVFETTKLAGRSVFTALAASGMQVWLARLVVTWEKPPDTEAGRDALAAVEAAFARWQGVVMLGCFNLLWMMWRSWRLNDSGAAAWLLPEFLMLCAALPLAVAVSSGGGNAFWLAGAVALKVLVRSLAPLAGFAPTALVLLMLAGYARDMALSFPGAQDGAWHLLVQGVAALMLAMLHGWLSLAGLFIMLHHGFHRHLPAGPAR